MESLEILGKIPLKWFCKSTCEYNGGIHIVSILANVTELKKIYFILIHIVTQTSVVVCEIFMQIIHKFKHLTIASFILLYSLDTISTDLLLLYMLLVIFIHILDL